MKLIISTCILAIVLVLVTSQDESTGKYDYVDVDEVLKNDRLLQNYSECILDKVKCTPEGEELKVNIKEALETGCAKCTDKHREGIRKVVKFLSEQKQDIWKEITEKYDPEGTYRDKYAEFLNKEETAAA